MPPGRLGAVMLLMIVWAWGMPPVHAQTRHDFARPVAQERTSTPAQEKTPIQRETAPARAKPVSSRSSLWMTYAILGVIVGGVVFGGRWLKRISPGKFGSPDGAIDVLGSRPLTPQHTVHVLSIGERVLIVGTGPDGMRTLSEITDPAESLHVTALCKSGAPESALPSHRSAVSEDSQSGTSASPFSTDRRRAFLRTGMMLLVAGLVNTPLVAQVRQGDGRGSDNRAYPSAYHTTPAPVRAFDTQRPMSSLWAVPPESPARAAVNEPPVINGFPAPAPAVTGTVTPEISTLTPLLQGTDLPSMFKLAAVVGVMSLAPAILLMTTCYVRIVVVLGLLRQAMGTMQFPPTQVLTSLSLFLTALVMWPIWERAYREGIQPYSQASYLSPEQRDAALQTAVDRTLQPVRSFMVRQIEATGNEETVDLFLEYQSETGSPRQTDVAYYEDVPTRVLLPSYLLSELKTAFLLGFQIFLPFVVIDLVVSSLLVSLGLVVLPPAAVALPFKLLLFVLIDGWHLTVEMLLTSIATI